MSTYFTRFTEATRLDDRTIRLATVEVYTLKGDLVGQHGFGVIMRGNDGERQIQEMVRELVREYQTRKLMAQADLPVWESYKATEFANQLKGEL